MAITLSSGLLKAMGFRSFAAGESVDANFTSLSLYEARGIVLNYPDVEVISGLINGVSYRAGIGAKLNEACKSISGDTYIDDEEGWRKEKGTAGPFLLILLGPTKQLSVTQGHIKDELDGSITTYDSFAELKNDLAVSEAAALPQLLTSLVCAFADFDLKLTKLERIAIGRTTDGRVVHDMQISVSAKGYASAEVSRPTLLAHLNASAGKVSSLNVKAAQFFALGLSEEDELKGFLYFFLSLEVETHSVFKSIEHATQVSAFLSSSAMQSSGIDLLSKQASQLKNLFDRFAWCAACSWQSVDDADVAQFMELKKIRDDIAHGNTSWPPAGSALKAQKLARKVLWP